MHMICGLLRLRKTNTSIEIDGLQVNYIAISTFY